MAARLSSPAMIAMAGLATLACSGRIAEQHGDGGGGTGAMNGRGGAGGGGATPAPFVPAALRLRVLTGVQYRNAIRDLLGPAAAAAVGPPPDTALAGFDAVGGAELSLSPSAVRQYEESAHAAAKAALADADRRAAIIGCAPSRPADDACLRTVVVSFGRRAWRRPLNATEVSAWVALGRDAATTYGDFHRGVELALAAFLQAPDFLYQVEVGVPDAVRGARRLTGYEMATRLSFHLGATTPKDALLDLAAAGALDTEDGVRAQARAILARPEARDATALFFDELLRLRDVPHISKDQKVFPTFNPALSSAMREETHRLLADVVWQRNGDFRDVLDAGYTHVNADLAAIYGISGAPASGFGRVELPAGSRRAGIFGQASFLALFSKPGETSPTARGELIREQMLCEQVPAPPPGVDTTIPPSPAGTPMTKRQRLEMVHRRDPTCAECHRLMDDIGFGLENFDALGRYRDEEIVGGRSLPIDAQAALDDRGRFAGARELGALLRADPRFATCLVRNLFRAATGHVETPGEVAPLARIDAAFAAAGFKFQELAVEIAASEAFRFGAAGAGGP